MSPARLKSAYGHQLCFHGGADVQQLLPHSTQPEIRTAIREIIQVMGERGGFILSPSHAVQVDTPPANIVAIYQEAGSLMDSLPGTVESVDGGSHYGPAPLGSSFMQL
jgi:uroporphyrinogen decarboxylase